MPSPLAISVTHFCCILLYLVSSSATHLSTSFSQALRAHQAVLRAWPQEDRHALRRLAEVSTISLNRTSQCIARPGRCWSSPLTLLTAEAPAPSSAGGKMFAKIASISYLCGQHTTSKQCVADTTNQCSMFSTSVGTVATSSWPGAAAEQWCDISDEYVTYLMLDYAVCPGSLFDKFLRCNATSKGAAECTANSAGCNWLENCNLFEPCCLPATLVSLNKTAQLELLQELNEAKPNVWGCCSGQKLWSKVIGCLNLNSSSDCRGDCYWDSFEGRCLVDRGAWFTALLDEADTGFAQYVHDADTKCEKFTDPGSCNSQPKLTTISSEKANQFSRVDIQKPSACVTPPAANNSTGNTTAAPAKSAGASITGSVQAFLLTMLGVFALLSMLS